MLGLGQSYQHRSTVFYTHEKEIIGGVGVMQCRGSLLHGGSWEWYISGSIAFQEQNKIRSKGGNGMQNFAYQIPAIPTTNSILLSHSASYCFWGCLLQEFVPWARSLLPIWTPMVHPSPHILSTFLEDTTPVTKHSVDPRSFRRRCSYAPFARILFEFQAVKSTLGTMRSAINMTFRVPLILSPLTILGRLQLLPAS